MNFLQVENKTFLITGVANKKSVAYSVAKELLNNGANIVLTVQLESMKEKVQKLFPDVKIYICDVESKTSLSTFFDEFSSSGIKLSGLLHSIAFANFSEGVRPFNETKVDDFLQATNISCFSLTSLAQGLKNTFVEDASVVAISISSTRATSYGYLGPIKACLDASVPFLAKAFSEFSKIRFNSVSAGPLKTSASAGIPGYIDNYIYAEKLTLRKQALKTKEVADTVVFLLSGRSSGINGESIVVDAGINSNYFDQDIVKVVASN